MTVKILNESNFDVEIKTGTVLVDFYADWCGPCRTLTPVIESLAEDLQGKASVVKVNVDASPKIASSFGIRGIPTLVVIKDGVVVNKKVGAATKQQLLELINLDDNLL